MKFLRLTILLWMAACGGAAAQTAGTLQNAATANANGNTLVVAALGGAIYTVNCAACSGGTTVNFEGTQDGNNYTPLLATAVGTTSTATSTAAAGLTYWQVSFSGLANIRARISVYSAGTVTVTASAAAPGGAGGTGGGGGGGGGAITAASGSYAAGALAIGAAVDGWDVTEGATTDAASSVGGVGSISAKLRLLTTLINTLNTTAGNPLAAGTNLIGDVGVVYPAGSTPIETSTSGTATAITATLAGTSGKTTYICDMTVRSNATAAATGTATVTGLTNTLNYAHWTAPLASGMGLTEEIYNPCQPASAANTSIVVTSPTPGSGGTVTVTARGYQM